MITSDCNSFPFWEQSDPENYDGPSSSSDDEDEEGGPGSHKLTRAQRKRLRKTKLKESASSAPQRRKIIGPLLQSAVNNPEGDGDSVCEDRPQGVRQNAPENQSQNTSPGACFIFSLSSLFKH